MHDRIISWTYFRRGLLKPYNYIKLAEILVYVFMHGHGSILLSERYINL